MPFGMGREEIQQYLDRMAGLDAYQDITQTTTSSGNTFLYSRTFLDPEYAAVLAEWIDVGQFDNPWSAAPAGSRAGCAYWLLFLGPRPPRLRCSVMKRYWHCISGHGSDRLHQP